MSSDAAAQAERVEGLLASVQDAVATLQKLGTELEREVARALYQDGVANGSAVAALEIENARLRTAVEGRAVIEQAKGVIIARQGSSEQEAFSILTRIARREKVSMRDAAAAIVEAGARSSLQYGGTPSSGVRTPAPADGSGSSGDGPHEPAVPLLASTPAAAAAPPAPTAAPSAAAPPGPAAPAAAPPVPATSPVTAPPAPSAPPAPPAPSAGGMEPAGQRSRLNLDDAAESGALELAGLDMPDIFAPQPVSALSPALAPARALPPAATRAAVLGPEGEEFRIPAQLTQGSHASVGSIGAATTANGLTPLNQLLTPADGNVPENARRRWRSPNPSHASKRDTPRFRSSAY